MYRGPIALNDRFLLALDDGPRVGVVTAINGVDANSPTSWAKTPARTIGVEFGTDLRRVTYEEGVFRHLATLEPAPRVTRFDVSAQMIVDMLVPGLQLKSARAINRNGFGEVVAFEVEHECVDIPAGFVSLTFREITALGGARVSIFHAADPVAEPAYPRAPYETPKLEAAYKARELLELFKACTPEERACVLDYLDADPRPAPLPPGAQLVEPLTEEQQAVVAALVEDGIAYARRFFGDFATGYVGGNFAKGGAVGGDAFTVVDRVGFDFPGLMGENGPEAIVPTERAYTFTHSRPIDRPGKLCGWCGVTLGSEEHTAQCAIFDWTGDDGELHQGGEPPAKLENAATEACAHRYVRAGLDVDGPIVKCADCGETIKRAGVLVFGTAGDPIEDAAVAVAIGKTFGG